MGVNLLGLPGALRKGSTNRMLLREAARVFGECDFVEADLNLPLYDGDLEEAQGIPAPVAVLTEQIRSADAVLISTPEYNKMLSGVLKNALDWVSRTRPQPWVGKPVVVMAAASGRAGGERAQASLVAAMTPFQPRLILGPEIAVAGSREEFDDGGRLVSARYEKNLTALMAKLRDAI
ncbi:NAD(P)H-dependent oxidoreductase [Aliiroseovarius crassostreae]|uniref:NADPH-dependent FMN reductase n=1 Tax=Aliiroseovarius crassostreae TaxID=154981 RepID=UPI0021FBA781|nr:NAD(P)H-dependent oxidoreductase [Aliiroseovarius crassostreae]UWQ08139.1 NAD(P)H-dependent oxidoreductase [Aliiroseovarius crassostreae]UWQ11239.1 NAD(P)H-dependent oxidoreductase [Aliiroseovarius crassostreae]